VVYQELANRIARALSDALTGLGVSGEAGIFEDRTLAGFRDATTDKEAPPVWGKGIQLIAPPRDWGITCLIAPEVASHQMVDQLVELQQKLGKKKAKRQFAKLVNPRAAELAKELTARVDRAALPEFSRIEAEGIYINFYFDPRVMCERVLAEVLREGERYGAGSRKSERVMIEFSQPNTHKQFHIGHLRNVLIGSALANLYTFAGYPVVRANYYGDHGIHVAKALWGFKELYGARLPAGEDALSFLGRVYAEVERKLASLEGTENLAALEARHLQVLAALDDASSDYYALWQETRQWCIDSFHSIYEELGVQFDTEFFESEVQAEAQQVVAELLAKRIAQRETQGDYAGTVFVDFAELSAPELGKMVLQRSDGTTLYQTKELVLARRKFTGTFRRAASDDTGGPIDTSLYVVGSEQKLYFKQIFKILEAWGFPQAHRCHHISYELVQLGGGKMSSREGTTVAYRDFVNEAIARARKLTADRGITQDTEGIAHQVALGAIKYAFLKVDPSKTIVFDWDQAFSFDGNAGPYLQYAFARAQKLIADFDPPISETTIIPDSYQPEPQEAELCRVIADFPERSRMALAQSAPSLVANYLYELTRAFTTFYDTCPVLRAEEPVRTFRRSLVFAFVLVLTLGGRKLLGLDLPSEM